MPERLLRSPSQWLTWLPYVAFMLGLAASTLAWQASSSWEYERTATTQNLAINTAKRSLIDKLEQAENIVRGAAEILPAQSDVSHANWKGYVDAMGVEARLPYLLALTYVAPSANHESCAVILSEPSRRSEPRLNQNICATDKEALMKALSTGQITLTQESPIAPTSPDMAARLILPIYSLDIPTDAAVEMREKAHRGWIVAFLKVSSLLKNAAVIDDDILVSIHERDAPDAQATLVYGGRAFAISAEIDGNTSIASSMILAIGLVLSLVAFGALQSLIVTRRRATELAQTTAQNLDDNRRLLETIAWAQSEFISDADPHRLFTALLEKILALTKSRFGFVLEITEKDGHPDSFALLAIANENWDAERVRAVSERDVAEFDFLSPNNPFNATLRTGKTVSAVAIPARGPLPAMENLLGLPLTSGSRRVGLIGLANRTGGVDSALIDFLRPLAGTCGALIDARQSRAKQEAAEQLVLDNAARFRATFESLTDGIVITDEKGTIQSINAATEKLFGYAPQELMGRNVKVLMPEPHFSQHDGYLENYRKTRKRKIIGIGREVEGRRKDGRVFPMDLSVSETVIGGQRIFTGVLRDITERKRTERMKDEFVSTVSHELRTPLTSIRGALGLALGGAAGEVPTALRGLLDIAHKNSERLVMLVNDILDIAKIEAGLMEFRLKPTALGELMRHALDSLRPYSEPFNVALELTDNAPGANALIDPDRFVQVLSNLVSNAVKYSPPGGTVGITLSRRVRSLRLSVQDHGPGIPESFRAQLFQKFAQADSGDTRAKGGTGLGLSIVKAIVECMGGHISYQSETGQGTVFHVDFPEEGLPAPAPASEDRQRVLICDDDEAIATLLKLMLENAGFEADHAANVERTRALLAQNRYAVLLLDILLPDGDGLVLAEDLRRNPETTDIPIVVVSAVTDQNHATVEGKALGIADWLTKPIDPKRLTNAVSRAVRGGSRPRLLHVEDDADLALVVEGLLRQTADVDLARTIAEARAKLTESLYDIVLLDIALPDGSGLELAETINALAEPPPILLFSASDHIPDLSQKVAAALVKSRTSEKQLLDTVRRLVRAARAHGGPAS